VLAVPSALLDRSATRATGSPEITHEGRIGEAMKMGVSVPDVIVHSLAIREEYYGGAAAK